MANLNVSSYLAQFTSADWTYQCVQKIAAAGNQSISYVGNGGRPLLNIKPIETWGIPNETWGINRETCIKFCNSTTIALV